MFTGIVQAIGAIESITSVNQDVKLGINTKNLDMSDVQEGDSIAVNGACLTTTNIKKNYFEAHVSKETLDVTTGLNTEGDVNLEKALSLNDRLGGHLVSGHVDGVGTVERYENLGDCWLLAIRAPHAISKYIARKGSVCVNGVSLTINDVRQDTFNMNIIPHTLTHTTLSALTENSRVNLEIDQIARYVERMTEWSTQ